MIYVIAVPDPDKDLFGGKSIIAKGSSKREAEENLRRRTPWIECLVATVISFAVTTLLVVVAMIDPDRSHLLPYAFAPLLGSSFLSAYGLRAWKESRERKRTTILVVGDVSSPHPVERVVGVLVHRYLFAKESGAFLTPEDEREVEDLLLDAARIEELSRLIFELLNLGHGDLAEVIADHCRIRDDFVKRASEGTKMIRAYEAVLARRGLDPETNPNAHAVSVKLDRANVLRSRFAAREQNEVSLGSD